MIEWDCAYCTNYGYCDLEDHKDHAYNLRDGSDDCFMPNDAMIIPPWFDSRTECYRCMKHTYEDCSNCKK